MTLFCDLFALKAPAPDPVLLAFGRPAPEASDRRVAARVASPADHRQRATRAMTPGSETMAPEAEASVEARPQAKRSRRRPAALRSKGSRARGRLTARGATRSGQAIFLPCAAARGAARRRRGRSRARVLDLDDPQDVPDSGRRSRPPRRSPCRRFPPRSSGRARRTPGSARRGRGGPPSSALRSGTRHASCVCVSAVPVVLRVTVSCDPPPQRKMIRSSSSRRMSSPSVSW